MKAIDLIEPFKNWKQFILGTIVVSVFFNFIFWQNIFTDPKIFVIAMFWSASIWLTQWLGNVFIGIKIGDKYSWFEQPKKRIFLSVVGIVVYSSIAFVLVQFLMHFIVLGKLPSDHFYWVAKQLKITIPISLLVAFSFNSIGFFQSWKESTIKAQKLETEMLRYKYESLQNHINPHFLFNSFNVLSDLVTEDQHLAVKFIDRLSGLYRYVLESREKELVPLSEELDFIEKFIFLLKIRFEDKVNFKINVEKTNSHFIVPMALQLLLENAVKHNVATTKNPLIINVTLKEKSLVVSNNLQEKKSIEHSTKTGLENLKQQYQFFTTNEIQITKIENSFIVKIPLLKK